MIVSFSCIVCAATRGQTYSVVVKVVLVNGLRVVTIHALLCQVLILLLLAASFLFQSLLLW